MQQPEATKGPTFTLHTCGAGQVQAQDRKESLESRSEIGDHAQGKAAMLVRGQGQDLEFESHKLQSH